MLALIRSFGRFFGTCECLSLWNEAYGLSSIKVPKRWSLLSTACPVSLSNANQHFLALHIVKTSPSFLPFFPWLFTFHSWIQYSNNHLYRCSIHRCMTCKKLLSFGKNVCTICIQKMFFYASGLMLVLACAFSSVSVFYLLLPTGLPVCQCVRLFVCVMYICIFPLWPFWSRPTHLWWRTTTQPTV